jgi:hypothetical protein
MLGPLSGVSDVLNTFIDRVNVYLKCNIRKSLNIRKM